jgi:TRAP-type transport system periplasmic protein
MKKSIVFVCCVLLSFVIYPGVSVAAEKVTKLDFSSFLPATNKLSIAFEEYCKEAEKRTNGAVKITLFPGGTLTPVVQTYDSVMKGIADMGFIGLPMNVGMFPLMEVLDLPFGGRNGAIMTRFANDFYKHFKPKELEGVKVLFFLTHGPGTIHTKKPVRKLEDLKGMKIRASGAAISEMIKALGGVPVVLPTPDVYDALNKGVVDGVVGLTDMLTSFKFGEVIHYTTQNQRSAYESTGLVAMNKVKWSSLSPDIQKIMDDLSQEYSQKMAKIWDDMEQDAIETLKAQKHTFIFLSKEEEDRWYQKIVPLYNQYIREKSAKGLPAAEAVKFCQDWMKKNQK